MEEELDDDIVDAEVETEIEETENLPSTEVSGLPATTKKKKGILGVKYRKIAALAVRGWSPVEIAKEMGLTVPRISTILERDDVWDFVIEEIRGLFSEGDRILASLYKKAMIGLDEDLSSKDPNVRRSTREQVFKLWGYGKNIPQDGERTHVSVVQQFFKEGQGQLEGGTKPLIQSMDEIILQKRKERGLKVEGDNGD